MHFIITGNSWTAIHSACVIGLSMRPSICLCPYVRKKKRLHKNCSRAGFIFHLPRMHLQWVRAALTPEAPTKEGPFFHSTSTLSVLSLPRTSARLPQMIFFAFLSLKTLSVKWFSFLDKFMAGWRIARRCNSNRCYYRVWPPLSFFRFV